MQKLPPVEKIYEAYSAIADGRVTMFEEYAVVASSNRKKEYIVMWDKEVYAANDNATYWQGYPGYPVIAVLMLQGKLPLDEDAAAVFSKVNWTQLNAETKRDYAKSVALVFEKRGCNPEEESRVRAEAERAFEALKNLAITTKRATKRPQQSPVKAEKE